MIKTFLLLLSLLTFSSQHIYAQGKIKIRTPLTGQMVFSERTDVFATFSSQKVFIYDFRTLTVIKEVAFNSKVLGAQWNPNKELNKLLITTADTIYELDVRTFKNDIIGAVKSSEIAFYFDTNIYQEITGKSIAAINKEEVLVELDNQHVYHNYKNIITWNNDSNIISHINTKSKINKIDLLIPKERYILDLKCDLTGEIIIVETAIRNDFTNFAISYFICDLKKNEVTEYEVTCETSDVFEINLENNIVLIENGPKDENQVDSDRFETINLVSHNVESFIHSTYSVNLNDQNNVLYFTNKMVLFESFTDAHFYMNGYDLCRNELPANENRVYTTLSHDEHSIFFTSKMGFGKVNLIPSPTVIVKNNLEFHPIYHDILFSEKLNKLFIASDNYIYKINPITLNIEDSIAHSLKNLITINYQSDSTFKIQDEFENFRVFNINTFSEIITAHSFKYYDLYAISTNFYVGKKDSSLSVFKNDNLYPIYSVTYADEILINKNEEKLYVLTRPGFYDSLESKVNLLTYDINTGQTSQKQINNGTPKEIYNTIKCFPHYWNSDIENDCWDCPNRINDSISWELITVEQEDDFGNYNMQSDLTFNLKNSYNISYTIPEDAQILMFNDSIIAYVSLFNKEIGFLNVKSLFKDDSWVEFKKIPLEGINTEFNNTTFTFCFVKDILVINGELGNGYTNSPYTYFYKIDKDKIDFINKYNTSELNTIIQNKKIKYKYFYEHFVNFSKHKLKFYPTEDNTFFVINESSYYSKTATRNYFTFLLENKVYPIEQFDLKYNRPDIILKQLEADKSLIKAYHQAYLKRLKKMQFTEDMLEDDFNLPKLKIKNFEDLPNLLDQGSIKLDIDIRDSKYPLDRINVWVNDVAVYGSKGISIRDKNILEHQTQLEVFLTKGKNKVQVSVLNQAGAESYKETFKIECTVGKEIPDLYIITIGVSEFEQTNFNLTYAAKDAQDMTTLFEKSKAYKNVFSKTLLNQDATIEKILALKLFLAKAGINDEVMIFIAGHGVLDANLDYYLATYDMDFQQPQNKGLAYDDLESLLDGIKPLKKTLIIDACHSGEIDKEEIELAQAAINEGDNIQFRAVGNSVAPKLGIQNTSELVKSLFTDFRKGSGATVISSAGGMEFAMEGDNWSNGLFTYCLMKGIKSGEADLNNDSEIWLSEIQQYVAEQVTKLSNGQQQPTSRIENQTVDFRVW